MSGNRDLGKSITGKMFPHHDADVENDFRHDVLGFIDSEDFRGKRVLDFGCGCGASTAIVSRLLPGANITGPACRNGAQGDGYGPESRTDLERAYRGPQHIDGYPKSLIPDRPNDRVVPWKLCPVCRAPILPKKGPPGGSFF